MGMVKKLAGTMIAVVLGFGIANAADEPAKPWSNVTDFGLVMTTGNSEANNFALGNKYAYKWSNAEFTLDAMALRAETTTRFLTSTDGVVNETSIPATTTESYALGAKYRHDITESFYWYTRAGWMQNKPTGIDSRLFGGGGVGYTFFKTDADTLAGEFGFEYTSESYTSDTFVPGKALATDSTSYATARGFLGYERKVGASSKFNAEFEAWENLKETSDWRARAMAAVTASLSKRLALKAAYTLLYDAEPIAIGVPDSVDPLNVPPGRYEFDKLDTVLTATLVLTF